MRKAGKLFEPQLAYFEIPFEGGVLPGFFRAAPGKGPHKTLLMIGGGETFAEDLVYYIAPQAFARGYNFATVDLPGQGLLPFQGKVFRTDTYVPLKAVVDSLVGRPEVDARYLAVYGFSGGGLFAPQAAMGKPSTDKPLFVDRYVPGFFTDDLVAKMMTAIAGSLAKNTGLDKRWIKTNP